MSANALKAVATGQVTQKPKTILDYLSDKRVAEGLAVVAGRLLQPDRLLRLCINAVKKTPKLLECDPQTVLGAMMTSAALGLEPNTVQQQAFLIPYRRRAKVRGEWVDVYDCQFQIGARGFITLGYRSPEISSWDARCIHDGDHWKEMGGSRSFLEHSVALKGRGGAIGAYSHVSLASGRETALVLPLDEIEKVRSRSETYRSLFNKLMAAQDNGDQKELAKAQAAFNDQPWVMWFDDMAEKTAIKKHAKKLPIAAGEALSSAAEIDSRADAGVLDLSAMTDPDLVRAVVSDEAEAPALEHSEAETLPVSGEAFGATQRQAEPVRNERRERPVARAQRKSDPAEKNSESSSMAAGFIERIDNANDPDQASAVLEEARQAGLSESDWQRVEQAHQQAWNDLPAA